MTGLEDDAFERPFSDKSIIGTAWNEARADIEALTAAGYSIVHESEIHGETVDHAATIADRHDRSGASGVFIRALKEPSKGAHFYD